MRSSPIPPLGTHLKEFIAGFPRDFCTFRFPELFTEPRDESNPRVWIYKKTWYIHTIEYYVALKRREILLHATT